MKKINNNKVSVLIPVYNHEKYIKECLDSILKQTYKNIEIIICDDGSSDNSKKVIENWILINNTDVEIKFLTQSNHGICCSLNRMISISTGEYISLCASDDYLIPSSIKNRMNYLINNEKNGCFAVIGDAYVIDHNSNVLKKSAMRFLYNANIYELASNINEELIVNWSVVGPTLLYKKEILNIIGRYDESLLVEDRDFYLRLLSYNMLHFINEPVAGYRIHSSNVSRKSIESKLKVAKDIASTNIRYINKFDGINRFFLKSYFIDLLLINMKIARVSYSFLFGYKILRKVFFIGLRKLW